MRTAVCTLAVVLALSASAFAQSQLLVGKRLVIKNPRRGITANKFLFLSKDTSVAAPGAPLENPRCMPFGTGTGLLTVSSTAGESFSIDLGGARCTNWTVNTGGTRWKYKDPTGNSCNVILIKAGVLQKAVCRGSQIAFALGAPQGSVDVVLSTGTAPRRWCTTFNDSSEGCVVKQDGSDGRRLVAVDCTSAAAACGASPSGAFVDQLLPGDR